MPPQTKRTAKEPLAEINRIARRSEGTIGLHLPGIHAGSRHPGSRVLAAGTPNGSRDYAVSKPGKGGQKEAGSNSRGHLYGHEPNVMPPSIDHFEARPHPPRRRTD